MRTELLLVSMLVACTSSAGADGADADAAAGDDNPDAVVDPGDGVFRVVMTKQTVVDKIREVAHGKGITNPMLIAGIANAETDLSHCRADYYAQVCKQTAGTPRSPSCHGGDVLVGNGDSSCNQGGLGLFQLDAGTQAQTIAHYGASVLSLDGNIGFGIEHIIEDVRICSLTPSFGSDRAVARRRAIAWLNGVARGSRDYATYFMCMSQHYNGAGTKAEADYYRGKTEDVFAHYGGAQGHPGHVATDGTPLAIRTTASTTGALLGHLANGAAVSIQCQKHGATLTGTFGTSSLWDDIGEGYVADVYVSTGSDGQVAPTCN